MKQKKKISELKDRLFENVQARAQTSQEVDVQITGVQEKRSWVIGPEGARMWTQWLAS